MAITAFAITQVCGTNIDTVAMAGLEQDLNNGPAALCADAVKALSFSVGQSDQPRHRK